MPSLCSDATTGSSGLVVDELDPPQHRVKNLVTANAWIELGISLLDLADDHVDLIFAEAQLRVVDEQQPAVGAPMRIAGVDIFGQPHGHDVDVGHRLEGAIGAPRLNLEFAQREVAAEAQIVLDEVDGDVHGAMLARRRSNTKHHTPRLCGFVDVTT